jgi:hypothetical protein
MPDNPKLFRRYGVLLKHPRRDPSRSQAAEEEQREAAGRRSSRLRPPRPFPRLAAAAWPSFYPATWRLADRRPAAAGKERRARTLSSRILARRTEGERQLTDDSNLAQP